MEIAMEEDMEFRQGLPLDYLTYMGVQNSDKVLSQKSTHHLPSASWSFALQTSPKMSKSRPLCLQDDPRRTKFFVQIETLMKKLTNYAPVDAAVDQKARDFFHDCLPPMLTTGM